MKKSILLFVALILIVNCVSAYIYPTTTPSYPISGIPQTNPATYNPTSTTTEVLTPENPGQQQVPTPIVVSNPDYGINLPPTPQQPTIPQTPSTQTNPSTKPAQIFDDIKAKINYYKANEEKIKATQVIPQNVKDFATKPVGFENVNNFLKDIKLINEYTTKAQITDLQQKIKDNPNSISTYWSGIKLAYDIKQSCKLNVACTSIETIWPTKLDLITGFGDKLLGITMHALPNLLKTEKALTEAEKLIIAAKKVGITTEEAQNWISNGYKVDEETLTLVFDKNKYKPPVQTATKTAEETSKLIKMQDLSKNNKELTQIYDALGDNFKKEIENMKKVLEQGGDPQLKSHDITLSTGNKILEARGFLGSRIYYKRKFEPILDINGLPTEKRELKGITIFAYSYKDGNQEKVINILSNLDRAGKLNP